MASDSLIKSVHLSAADYDINDIMSKNLSGNLATTDACYLAVMQRFKDFIGINPVSGAFVAVHHVRTVRRWHHSARIPLVIPTSHYSSTTHRDKSTRNRIDTNEISKTLHNGQMVGISGRQITSQVRRHDVIDIVVSSRNMHRFARRITGHV